MRWLAVAGGLLFALPVMALEFLPPRLVTEVSASAFLHLDGSGRRLLAVNGQAIAVIWEDSRDGHPAIRAAFATGDGEFGAPQRLSGPAPAFEPAVAPLGNGFVACWEETARIHCRQIGFEGRGRVRILGRAAARQISLAPAPDGTVAAVWAERAGRHHRIVSARLVADGDGLRQSGRRIVDATAGEAEQLYPAVAVTRHGTVVAWEDRRQGATRIFTAFAPPGAAFGGWSLLNDFRPSRIRRFGNGTGAMRPALAGDDAGRVSVVWLDKRDFEGGYDVYAALSTDGGRHFGHDELVQDPLGENTPQWHPGVAMTPDGRIVAAWDDSREGTSDVWYSERGTDGWSDDETPPGGDGEGRQTHPALACERDGTLFLLWREEAGDRIRLWLSRGRVRDGP